VISLCGALQTEAVLRSEDRSGSTAITAFVTPTHIIVGNCGDSRSVLVRGNKAVAMSEDHKPTNASEEQRIVKAGGTVTMRRVNGDLAVSRALGDFLYKAQSDLPAVAQQVSAEPEIRIEDRTDQDQVSKLPFRRNRSCFVFVYYFCWGEIWCFRRQIVVLLCAVFGSCVRRYLGRDEQQRRR
jgi:serine/threonine protein phosphatase PrpC